MNFGKDIMNIQLPEEFVEIIDSYHREFINSQINKIDMTSR